jgi:hypothetical protein
MGGFPMKNKELPDHDMVRFFTNIPRVEAPESVVQKLRTKIAVEGHPASTNILHRSGVLVLRRQVVMAVILTLLIAVPLTFFASRYITGKQAPAKSYVIRFVYESREAHTVQILGDFNSWNSEQTEMIKIPNTDLWSAEVVLSEGLYRYGFLIDNTHWALDPIAKINVKDDFGKESSLIMLLDEREDRKNL